MNDIQLTINEKKYTVQNVVPAETSLNNFIRNYANLRGTKAMCHEGGCGACVVAVRATHPISKEEQIFSVNSCLVSIFSCHGWAVTTVEGVGNRKDGYHATQSRLAGFNGTQCGYCTPGWVMSMYSLFEHKKHKMTMKEVENSFAGNICRCTGYRPILDAFKSMATDATPKLIKQLQDIEDLSNINMCAKSGLICNKTCTDFDHDQDWCKIGMETSFRDFSLINNVMEIDLKGHKWFKVFHLDDVFKILDKEGLESYMFVAGNTGQGVYHILDLPKILIDITAIEELRAHYMEVNLVLGGGMSLSETMELFITTSNQNDNFSYLTKLHKHLDLVAHYPVRNIGTIAGNLSLKHQHNDFQSDVFLLLEAVGATITLLAKNNVKKEVTPSQYLSENMKGRLILDVRLPPFGDRHMFTSFKIMPRAQNAHALVNAGLNFYYDVTKTHIEKARIVFGSISSTFIHATATEKLLVGKDIFNTVTLQQALNSLNAEIVAEPNPPEPSPKFRKKLALALFYKGVLALCPPAKVSSRVRSGAVVFDRPVSKGKQVYDTDNTTWPVTKPIPKLEALVQCSGEAKYVNDLSTIPNENYAAFVLSNVANGDIDKIDDSEAKKLDGFVTLYTAKDIPGRNSFTPPQVPLQTVDEEILCSGKVLFHGQPVAMVVAKTEKQANRAAQLVRVTYKNGGKKKPVLTIRDALKDPKRILHHSTTEPTDRGHDVRKVIYGSYDIFGQYHYTMETQTCVVVPIEDGLDVHASSQWMDLTNIAIALALNIPENRINIYVRRLGGAYGCKITRATQVACACALAAKLLNEPCRFVMSIETNMSAVGKRLPCSADFEVGVNLDGEIQYLKHKFYEDNGATHNELIAPLTIEHFYNCYEHNRWGVDANSVITDTPSNTWCRSPGSCEGVAMIEHIMESISHSLNKDHIAVRLANMRKKDNPLPRLIPYLKKDADYDNRVKAIEQFNNDNRWRKRGIRLTPMLYRLNHFGTFETMISVYHADGTVSVVHGGIEMGQGINTKVAQVVAYKLGVPLENISIKPSNNLTTPNAIVSGGSIASESVCFAAIKACEELLTRLAPIKKTLSNPTWAQITAKAYLSGVNLQTSYLFTAPEVPDYDIFGVTIAEVEIDILSGNHQILRIDLLEDTGMSMSPEIDVGQTEGAYLMGIGYWTSETLEYDKQTGALLTNRTWTYKPPGAKDIPLDLRVQFQRNNINASGVLRSKATGEPPLCMAVGVTHALRAAVAAARKDSGYPADVWFDMDLPYTTENILLAINTKLDEYVL